MVAEHRDISKVIVNLLEPLPTKVFALLFSLYFWQTLKPIMELTKQPISDEHFERAKYVELCDYLVNPQSKIA